MQAYSFQIFCLFSRGAYKISLIIMPKIILATGSPYRKEAFSNLGLEFASETSNVEECFEGRPDSPEKLVIHLARRKAEVVAENHKGGIIIGFDSVGWFKGSILEKPKSRKEAFQRLKSLSGNKHQFYTGIYMINLKTGKNLSRVVKTDVFLREFKDFEIKKYLDQDERFDTYALGYDPLGHYSISFVEQIKGSYNNLLRGIPLEAIVKMLFEVGYEF